MSVSAGSSLVNDINYYTHAVLLFVQVVEYLKSQSDDTNDQLREKLAMLKLIAGR